MERGGKPVLILLGMHGLLLMPDNTVYRFQRQTFSAIAFEFGVLHIPEPYRIVPGRRWQG